MRSDAAYTSYLDDAPDADQAGDSAADPLDPFFADGTIVEVVGELKSGKEGTVYLCRAHPRTEEELVAAKVYRAREHRVFRNDSLYSEGRSFGKRRENLAVKNKTRKGRDFAFSAWLSHEWEILSLLHSAGASVPRPIARAETAILMQYVGTADDAAPGLHAVRPDADEARRLFGQVMDNVELCLRCNVVHGDLSPYNILYTPGQVTLIDFPQAVDPRTNSSAFDLLARDVDHLCEYFVRCGLHLDPVRITQHLWNRYLRMEL